MKDIDNLNELKEIVKSLDTLSKAEFEEVSRLVDVFIDRKVETEEEVSHLFDRMLSLVFVEETSLHKPYFKLLNYTETFNKVLSKDYKKFYIEKYKD